MPEHREQVSTRRGLELSDKRVPQAFLLLRAKDNPLKNVTSAFVISDRNNSGFAGFVLCQGSKGRSSCDEERPPDCGSQSGGGSTRKVNCL